MTEAEAAAAAARQNDRLLRYVQLDKLLEAGRNDEIKFLDGRFLIDWYSSGKGHILRRQDMELLGAFLPPHVLTQEQADSGRLELFALSYCWSSPGHPDPDCFHVERVVKVLQAFLAGSKPANSKALYEQGFTNLTNAGLERAGYTFGPAKDDASVGVFWDFASLPQKEFRDDAEKDLFKRGLGSINAIYAHQKVTKLVMPELPEASRSLRPGYDGSGWTRFELEVANLASPPHRLIRLDGPYMLEHVLPADEIPGDAWIKLSLEGGKRIERKGPKAPEEFAEELKGLKFTNGADAQLVLSKYTEAFDTIVANAQDFSVNSFGLSTEAARQLLEVLQRQCQDLRSLNLGNSPEVKLDLEEVAQHVGHFKLEELDLTGCLQLRGSLAAMITSLWHHHDHLKKLELDSCERVEGDLEHLQPFVNLEHLDLQLCPRLRGDLRSLSGFKHLQYLNLEECAELEGELGSLAALVELQVLCLRGCGKVTGKLSCLAGLLRLQTLDLTSCSEVEGDLAVLSQIAELQVLMLRDCSKVIGKLSSLAGLPRLQTLDLTSCSEVEGDLEALSHLAELQVLMLRDCSKVTGKLSSLAGLPRLQKLDLTSCSEVEGDLEALSHLTELKILFLAYCHKVTGNLSCLAGLLQMQVLILAYCSEVEGDLAALSPLANLQQLYLRDCSRVYGRLPQGNAVQIVGYDSSKPRLVASSTCCSCM